MNGNGGGPGGNLRNRIWSHTRMAASSTRIARALYCRIPTKWSNMVVVGVEGRDFGC